MKLEAIKQEEVIEPVGQEVFHGTLEELLINDDLMVRLNEADQDIPVYEELSRAELRQIISQASASIRVYQSQIENAIRYLIKKESKVVRLHQV